MEHQAIIYSNDIANALDRILGNADFNKVIILTDKNANQFVLPKISDIPLLASSPRITIAAGDVNKNLDTAAMVWQQLVDNGATRKTILLNIGGGVVTDLGGFAASVFKRGIKFINIPTTLLGAVDASIGGKTGVNFSGLKNEIGVFNEASAVIISTLFFDTLPQSEMKSGYAEMLKHGLLSDKEYFNDLIAYDITGGDLEHLLHLLKKSVMLKERIVKEDPHEHGIRKALNLGHTAGHAFESLAMKRNAPVPHGYAVAWGLVVELVMSHMLYQFPSVTLHDVARFVADNYGAFHITCEDYDEIISLMKHDKKSLGGEINVSLLEEIGKIKVGTVVSIDDVKTALDIYRDLMHI